MTGDQAAAAEFDPLHCKSLEMEVCDLLESRPKLSSGPIFVLQSPRVGGTVLYQAMITAFGLPYFSNFAVARFPRHPVVGMALAKALFQTDLISFSSRFGKTDGALQPSEASAVMSNWFGGGHPSEIMSTDFLPGMEAHFVRSLTCLQRLFSTPVVIKNAWNSFRIGAIARAWPESAFVWIRRDISAAARSDMVARYATQKNLSDWNSATPRNWESLRQRPHWEQVIENQYEFRRAISEGLASIPAGRKVEVWYEDFCSDINGAMDRIGSALDCLGDAAPNRLNQTRVFGDRSDHANVDVPQSDFAALEAYMAEHAGRLTDRSRNELEME